jgi:hypothetical protein
MPAIVILLILISTLANLQIANLKLVSQASQLARAYAIAESPSRIQELASELRVQVRLGKESDWLCVTASRMVKNWLLPNLGLSQTQCALAAGR